MFTTISTLYQKGKATAIAFLLFNLLYIGVQYAGYSVFNTLETERAKPEAYGSSGTRRSFHK